MGTGYLFAESCEKIQKWPHHPVRRQHSRSPPPNRSSHSSHSCRQGYRTRLWATVLGSRCSFAYFHLCQGPLVAEISGVNWSLSRPLSWRPSPRLYGWSAGVLGGKCYHNMMFGPKGKRRGRFFKKKPAGRRAEDGPGLTPRTAALFGERLKVLFFGKVK